MPKTNDTTYQINQPVVFFPGALCDERIFNLCWQYLDIPMRAFVPLQWAEDLAQIKMLSTDRLAQFHQTCFKTANRGPLRRFLVP